jgi:hypothetical protein
MLNEYFLVIECKELDDPYECDCERIPKAIVKDWEKYLTDNEINRAEVYKINSNGSIGKLVRGYDEISEGKIDGYAVYSVNGNCEIKVIKQFKSKLKLKDFMNSKQYEAWIHKYFINNPDYQKLLNFKNKYADCVTDLFSTDYENKLRYFCVYNKETDIELYIGQYKGDIFALEY